MEARGVPTDLELGMRAYLIGRRLIVLATLVVMLGLAGFSALDNALHYRSVTARVERIEEVCVRVGAPMEEATGCSRGAVDSSGRPLAHHYAVHVRYTSDDREYTGVVIPRGGSKAVEAGHLRPGDEWTILVARDDPEKVKAE